MKSLLKLIEKQKIAGILLLVLAFVVFPVPHASAESEEMENLVFPVSNEHLLASLNDFQLSFEDLYISESLRNYLASKKSPLAACDELWKLPQWEHAMGIVFVESTYGRFSKNNNIASIGGGPSSKTWRKYETVCDGFKDLTVLLEKPMYKERLNTCAKKIGVYVVPGSARWKQGCEKVQKEMEQITANAKLKSQSMVDSHKEKVEQNSVLAFSF